jgi:hypothetical protein
MMKPWLEEGLSTPACTTATPAVLSDMVANPLPPEKSSGCRSTLLQKDYHQ